MAILNLDVHIISDPSLQTIIDDIQCCMTEAGLILPKITVGEPGIGALLESIVRSLEASLIASWKPMIALIQVIVKSLKKGIKAPAEFLKQVASLVSGLADLAGVEKLLKALICEVAGPLIDNLLVILPSIEILLDLLMGRLTIIDVIRCFPQYLKEGKIMIPKKLKDLGIDFSATEAVSSIVGRSYVENVLQLWKIPINANLEEMIELTPIIKIMSFIFFPIKLAQGLICAVITLVKGLVTNIFKGVAKMSELLSNPGKFIMNMLGSIISPILISLMHDFMPPDADIEMAETIAAAVAYLIKNILTLNGKKFCKWLANTKTAAGKTYKEVLGLLMGFVKMIVCVIKWFFCFITDIPQMITMFMYPIIGESGKKTMTQSDASALAAPPPLPSVSYDYKTKTLVINPVLDNGEIADISTLYAKGDFIEFTHGTLNKKYKVEIAKIVKTTNKIVLTSDPTLGEDFVKDAKGNAILTNNQKTLLGKNDVIGDKNVGIKKVKK